MNLDPQPPDSPAEARTIALTEKPTYAVAHMHAHTTTQYWSSGVRVVGPSDADKDASTLMTGIVIDYIASGTVPNSIPAGYPKNSPAKKYNANAERRSTPL